MKMFRLLCVALFGSMLALVVATAVMGAYSAHQNDQDVNKFLDVYPFTRSSKLNDCSLCHPGGEIESGGKLRYYGSCDYCHEIYGLEPPHGPIPLNGYGEDYKAAGRSYNALRNIEPNDSDGDTFVNKDEIHELTFPGDEKDYPGLVTAPSVVLSWKQIQKLPHVKEFLLLNTTRKGDFYATYKGVKISDILEELGVLPEATHVTFFAPDGFSKTFPIEVNDPQTPPDIQYDVMGPYPKGFYFPGLDFVEYPDQPVYGYGEQIPDKLHMILADNRDGGPLQVGRLELQEGRLVLEGEGPYREVPPQKVAGSPDRSVNDPPLGDEWDFDENKDHNAGFSVRSVTAIRVEPLPEGTTDYNWTEGGWELVDQSKLVVYGAINPPSFPVTGHIKDKSGAPLADVRVSFGLPGWTLTDAGGDFQKNLPIGDYTMVPSKEGFVFKPESKEFTLTSKGYKQDFTGYPAHVVSGQVLTPAGTPVPDVRVKAKKTQSYTGPDGQYFQSVVAGVIKVKPKAKGFRFDPKKRQVDCTAGDVANVDFLAMDKKRPKLKITSPKKNTHTSDAQVNIMGTVEDNFRVEEVRWQNGAQSDVADINPDGTWTATVPLEMGVNKVTVTAMDEAGNAKSRKLKIIRE